MHVVYDAPLPDESIAEMLRLVPGLRLSAVPENLPQTLLADAHVLYTHGAQFEPAQAPNLKWVQINSASTQMLWNKPIMQTAIPVCNASGAYSTSVAEFAIGMLLSLTRKITRGVRFQSASCWPPAEAYESWAGADLRGLTMGIVGYGSIGREVARLAQPFGMTVLACKRRPEERRDDSYLLPGTGDPEGRIPVDWYGMDRRREMLAKSNVVVVALPGIPITNGLIGAGELDVLPRGAWLVNVGRGSAIDEPALIHALQAGKIAGAALDVFVEEPLPADSPLWDLPNVLVMPHIASFTTRQAGHAAGVLIENLRRDQSGEPLINVIDKELLY